MDSSSTETPVGIIEVRDRWTGEVRFFGTCIRDVVLANKSELSGCDLSGFDLRGLDLRGSDLNGSDCYGSDFRGSDFRGSNLRAVDFGCGDLRGCDMTDCDLSFCDLRGSKLSDSPIPAIKDTLGVSHPKIDLADERYLLR